MKDWVAERIALFVYFAVYARDATTFMQTAARSIEIEDPARRVDANRRQAIIDSTYTDVRRSPTTGRQTSGDHRQRRRPRPGGGVGEEALPGRHIVGKERLFAVAAGAAAHKFSKWGNKGKDKVA